MISQSLSRRVVHNDGMTWKATRKCACDILESRHNTSCRERESLVCAALYYYDETVQTGNTLVHVDHRTTVQTHKTGC